MGNMQSEPSAGGGSRKEQASDRASDSRRTSLGEPEVTPSSPAMRLARGLGVWFPSSSAPPGLLVSPQSQASPSSLPLTLELPSPVTPPVEEAPAAAVSAPPPAPGGTLLPAPSKWRKPTGTSVPRIRSLLEASHRGQGDPPSLRPLPPRPRQHPEEDPAPAPSASAPSPPPLELRRPPPPPPSDRQPHDRRNTPALAAPAATPTEREARSESRPAGGARGGAPPEAGGGEMARPAPSESGLSLLCKVTFKSGPPLAPAAASGSLGAKASLGSRGGGGLFPATSGAISYAEVLKQGPLASGATRPSGETPRGSQEAEGGDGDGEGCSGLPSAPASRARAPPPPSYTTFPGPKPKFDWVRPLDGSERHFRFNGAGGVVGPPRRRPAALSAPWTEPTPPVPAPVKARTRRNKGPRAARGATREDGAPGEGPRERTMVNLTDGGGGANGGGKGAPPAGAANSGAVHHWPPFQVLNSCPCKCYCRHQPRHRRLPRNVSAWLSTPTNHLSEPPWVATIKLAGSLVAGLDHYDHPFQLSAAGSQPSVLSPPHQ
ncbi:gametogenetin [Orycteropus afer afer]|uniref:Gametogenetin n=1 Tax=Orycteropus afer afer TaxID=1230840 RepID=A0A8B7B0M3_ORYAF|nr:gametogenetin [Orycteropus afer afer]